MRDFTLITYRQLLEALLLKGYAFSRFDEWAGREGQSAEHQSLSAKHLPLCILRHDVDLLPSNSLITASIEKDLGIRGSYYFRMIPEVFNESIIKDIEALGHEIGYHYEEMDSPLLISPQRGENDLEQRIDEAYELFKVNLEKMRSVAEVKTICMHGSPLSSYDNKIIWQKYSYKDLGIIGEPYFDIDWHQFGYLTDTGRRWNGSDVSVRDKVSAKNAQFSILNSQLSSTKHIINAIEENKLPDKIMITVHPQRWTDGWIAWMHELVWQNVKNVVKRFIVIREDA